MGIKLEQRPRMTVEASGDEALHIIKNARADMGDHFRVVPLHAEFPRLQQQLGVESVGLAIADDNHAGTYKARGSRVGAEKLKEAGYEAAVSPSAGNAAMGAALAAKALGIGLHVVMPESAPNSKKQGVVRVWDQANAHPNTPQLRVHIQGNSFDESLRWALDNAHLGALLHPFDDPNVIRGQGTIADDILEATPDVEHIVVPVGGGGLVAGILQRLDEKERGDVTVHAVEATGSNSLSTSLANGQLTSVERPNARYGGSAVRRMGEHTFKICQKLQHRLNVFTVDDELVTRVTQDYEQDRSDTMRYDSLAPYEPTTLVAITGLLHVTRNFNGPTVVVGTGHNAPLWPEHPRRQRRRI